MADKYQIPFINACIRAFAKRVGLPVKNVFQYLDRFKGVEFLVNFYPTLHLQSVEDTVDDLIVMCKWRGTGMRLYHGTNVEFTESVFLRYHPRHFTPKTNQVSL